MLTAEDLTRLAKACGAKPNALVVAGIVENQHWLSDGGLTTSARVAEFLAQACLETDYFRVLQEYASGKAYEGRRDLGNVVAGDGVKFKGRGIFQCTGRDNYARYGKRLGIDLLKEPALAAQPEISVRIAVMYWNDKGLNAYADRGETAAISRAINRGNPKATKPANHEADRIKIAALARQIIKVAEAPISAGVEPVKPSVGSAPKKQVIDMLGSDPSILPPAVIVRDEPISKAAPWWAAVVNTLLRKEP